MPVAPVGTSLSMQYKQHSSLTAGSAVQLISHGIAVYHHEAITDFMFYLVTMASKHFSFASQFHAYSDHRQN